MGRSSWGWPSRWRESRTQSSRRPYSRSCDGALADKRMGWGVDALLEKQSREHRDIDIVLCRSNVPHDVNETCEEGCERCRFHHAKQIIRF
jgi:hypothetical protein